jgi:hypothetical protein
MESPWKITLHCHCEWVETRHGGAGWCRHSISNLQVSNQGELPGTGILQERVGGIQQLFQQYKPASTSPQDNNTNIPITYFCNIIFYEVTKNINPYFYCTTMKILQVDLCLH